MKNNSLAIEVIVKLVHPTVILHAELYLDPVIHTPIIYGIYKERISEWNTESIFRYTGNNWRETHTLRHMGPMKNSILR